MLHVVLSIVFALLACPIYAGEIHFLGGYGATNNPVQNAGAWQVRYMEGLGENFAYSLSYVNQGHFISHHRDGIAANLWIRTNQIHKQLSLGVGAGPIFCGHNSIDAQDSFSYTPSIKKKVVIYIGELKGLISSGYSEILLRKIITPLDRFRK